MSKRRLSLQQSMRMKAKEQQQADSLSHSELFQEGLVITRAKNTALIENSQGQRFSCAIRPSVDSLVAGDRVIWQQQDHHQGAVCSYLPRKTVLGRPDKEGRVRPIAANISQLILVVAPQPEITWSLVDSYLIVAEYLQLNLTILLNKADIACDDLYQQLRQYYAPLNYPLMQTGFHDPKSYLQLQKILSHETSIFIGQSGVGKSSLVNKIRPDCRAATGPISIKTQLGQHTTSNSYLYHLPEGGCLIDSPGIREFGLWHMPHQQIAAGFREFQPLLAQCKFRNCNHHDSPGCAIIAAVKKGHIAQQRYQNYVKIMTQFTKTIK